MKTKTFQRGFTIIEVLVATAILTSLAAIAYFNVADIREQGRDTAQIAQMGVMKLALRAYYEANGAYPEPNPSCHVGTSISGGRSWYSSTLSGCNQQYILGMVPSYISEIPSHTVSRNPSCQYIYLVATDRQRYKLLAQNCTESRVIEPGDEYYRCPITANGTGECIAANAVSNGRSFAVYSRGAENW